MIISREKLKELFVKGEETKNWDPFFREVKKITEYTINKKFINAPDKEELIQDCQVNIWKQIMKNKIDRENNIFSYIMGSISFTARDAIRKNNRRTAKAKIILMDNQSIFDFLSKT